MWIIIAGPYRSGASSPVQRQANLDRLNRAALSIFERGHVPVIGVNMALPVIGVGGAERYDEIMMPLSLALAERCDGVLRLDGMSAGADLEVETIRLRGGSVFHSLSQIPLANDGASKS